MKIYSQHKCMINFLIILFIFLMVFSTLEFKKIFSIYIQLLEFSLILIGEASVAVIIVTLEFFKVC